MKSEKFRSFTLFILFAVFIGFSGQIFLDFSFEDKIEQTSIDFLDVKINDILYPQSTHVSFGGSLHTTIFPYEKSEELWDATRVYLKEYLELPIHGEIDSEEWKMLKESKSVNFALPLEIEISDIYNLYEIEKIKENKLSMKINCILIKIDEKSKIYLGNTKTKKYVYLEGSLRDNGISYLVDDIYNSEALVESKEIEAVYSIKSVLDKMDQKGISAEGVENFVDNIDVLEGIKTNKEFVFEENGVLIPISAIKDVSYAKVKNEINPPMLSDEELQEYANYAFGNKFNFVRKLIDDDGSVAYMYGYGDKALRLGIHGAIEYRERVSENFSDEGFYKELDQALNFVRKYGRLPKSLYLASYSESRGENGINRKYGFNFRINDMVVFNDNFENNEALTIEVVNGQIVFFNKNIKEYTGSYISSEEYGRVLGLDEIIEANYYLISSNFMDDERSINVKINSSEYIYHILQEIKSFELILYNSNNFVDSDVLMPSWEVNIGDTQYIFNAYNGDVLFYNTDSKGE